MSLPFLFTEPPTVELDISVRAGIQILAGKTLKIPAIVTGRPAPTIEWTLEDGEIDKERVVIENVGTSSELTIKNALRKDHGRYVITATNDSGSKFAATRAEIFGMKYYKQQNEQKRCLCFLVMHRVFFFRCSWTSDRPTPCSGEQENVPT